MRGIREVYVNAELIRVYDGDVLIGHLRKGIDRLWYPELPPSPNRTTARHDLIRAFDSMRKYAEAL